MTGVDRILALDLAACTGWATLDEQGLVTAGRELFEGPLLDRLNRLDRWLREAIAELGPALIAIEGQFIRGNSSVSLGAMVRVARERANAEEIACMLMSPAEVRKQIGLGGRATKDQVMAEVRRLGHLVDGHDEADAVALLLAAAARVGR